MLAISWPINDPYALVSLVGQGLSESLLATETIHQEEVSFLAFRERAALRSRVANRACESAERFERESERNREKRGRRKRETANRSLNERGDWRFNQHADVPGTDIPWLWSVGVGVPWDAASGDSLPNKTRETEKKIEREWHREDRRKVTRMVCRQYVEGSKRDRERTE